MQICVSMAADCRFTVRMVACIFPVHLFYHTEQRREVLLGKLGKEKAIRQRRRDFRRKVFFCKVYVHQAHAARFVRYDCVEIRRGEQIYRPAGHLDCLRVDNLRPAARRKQIPFQNSRASAVHSSAGRAWAHGCA